MFTLQADGCRDVGIDAADVVHLLNTYPFLGGGQEDESSDCLHFLDKRGHSFSVIATGDWRPLVIAIQRAA